MSLCHQNRPPATPCSNRYIWLLPPLAILGLGTAVAVGLVYDHRAEQHDRLATRAQERADLNDDGSLEPAEHRAAYETLGKPWFVGNTIDDLETRDIQDYLAIRSYQDRLTSSPAPRAR